MEFQRAEIALKSCSPDLHLRGVLKLRHRTWTKILHDYCSQVLFKRPDRPAPNIIEVYWKWDNETVKLQTGETMRIAPNTIRELFSQKRKTPYGNAFCTTDNLSQAISSQRSRYSGES